MTREQAINYLICRGITEYRVSEIVRALTYEPTTKNNLPRCQHTDEEIAKSFIEDVEAVKDQLPCFCEQMDFPNTFDEFANIYGFKDKDEVYTNGSELIPVFRVKQWLEHISTTKNNLGVEEATALAEWTEKLTKECEEAYNKGYADGMKAQEPKTGHWISHREHCENLGIMMPNSIDVYEWCSNCDCGIDVREWYRSNYNYCPNCGAKMGSEG